MASSPTLADVVFDLCSRAGLDPSTEVDVSRLTAAAVVPSNIILGYLIYHQGSAAQALKILMDTYFFDACESGGTLRFVPRGGQPALTIPEIDLGLEGDKAKLHEAISQEQDLHRDVTVLFNDQALDFQQGKQMKMRNSRVVNTKNSIILTLPFSLTDDQAAQIAEITLYQEWIERNSFVMNLFRALYMLLDPTDVICFIYEGITFQIRIVDTSLGRGMAVNVNGVSQNPEIYQSAATGASNPSFAPAFVRPAGNSMLFMFDTPLLRDVDANPGGTGFYYGMSSAIVDWNGGILYESQDDSTFVPDDNPDYSDMQYGYATTALPNPSGSPFVWDNVNTITVTMVVGALAGDTMANVLNGSNALIVGSAANGFEVLQFLNAVQNEDGSYTLSGLLRGRRGTEWACGFWGDFANSILSHAVGDLVAAPLTGIKRLDESLAIINQPLYYRGVTIGQDPSAVPSQTFTDTGNDLRPYAPIQVMGYLDSGGNVVLTWVRRTRIGGDNWGLGVDTPVSEDFEAYQVDIKSADDSTVVRTLPQVSSPTVAYPLAQQISDFGAAPTTLIVDVYQMSGEIGRGFKGHGVISLTATPPPPASTGSCGCGILVNGS